MNGGRSITLSLPPFTKAVKWLIFINAGTLLFVYVLAVFSRDAAGLFQLYLSLIPFKVLRGWVFQLITYSFLHEGFWHLAGNMFGLWMFGAQLETEWGRRRFLEFYFYCVVGAALTTIALSYTGLGGISPATKTVGASGGVLGVLMAFGLIWGDSEIMLFPIPIRIRAKYFVAIVAFLTVLGALGAASGRGESIAYSAHLGGLLFGFLYVKFLPRRGLSYATSEKYFSLRNSYYRWKRRRAAKKFEVYMRQHDRKVSFDEHGNYIPPEEDKKNGGSKSGWVN